MNDVQQKLYDQVRAEAGQNGENTRDVLLRSDAPAADKAAVADALGGPGAGDEFLTD